MEGRKEGNQEIWMEDGWKENEGQGDKHRTIVNAGDARIEAKILQP
jgi:hypothetical protein